MKTKPFITIVVVLFSFNYGIAQNRPRKINETSPYLHDPVMAQEGDKFYIFSTGWGVSMFSSDDLQKWKIEPPVFKYPPQWAIEKINGYRGHTWAPDIIYHNGKYHLFYSCSTFGKNRSAIGHAVRTTLNPNDTLNNWEDTGLVIESTPGTNNWNAIDPAVIIDKKGRAWMSFGSFWDGIQIVRLNKDLTRPAKNEKVKTIARRTVPNRIGKENAVEAPFLFHHNNYYYLFVSFDYCCRGEKSDYHVVVGRSPKINGPYVDRNGIDMADGGGTLVIAPDSIYAGAGHSAAYHFNNKDYFVCHGYDLKDEGASKLIMKEIFWDEEDWPTLQPTVLANINEQ